MIKIGQEVTSEELSKIITFIVRHINELTEQNINNANTGNFLGAVGAKIYEPLNAETEQYSGYLGGTVGLDSWLDRLYNDVQEVINR